jgi:hypothetical protein
LKFRADFHVKIRWGLRQAAKELYAQILARYPEWLNRGALWGFVTAMRA